MCVCVCLRPERKNRTYRDSIHFLFMGDISLQNVQRKPSAPRIKIFSIGSHTHEPLELIHTACTLDVLYLQTCHMCRSQFKPAVIWVPVACPSSPTSPVPFWPLIPDITQAFSSTQQSLCCDEMIRVQISSGWWNTLQCSTTFWVTSVLLVLHSVPPQQLVFTTTCL